MNDILTKARDRFKNAVRGHYEFENMAYFKSLLERGVPEEEAKEVFLFKHLDNIAETDAVEFFDPTLTELLLSKSFEKFRCFHPRRFI